jgi:release factor glutamine methyltransferase
MAWWTDLQPTTKPKLYRMSNRQTSDKSNWNIVRLLKWATDYFSAREIDSPRMTAEVLLSHVLDVRRLDLYLNYDQPLNSEELQRFKALLKRRIAREPLAYITGRKAFWTLDLEVDRNCLIPRPDTECLVEAALNFLHRHPEDQSLRVVDLGTGSGAIVLALAAELPRHHYFATDRSYAAIRLARRNARRHGLASYIQFLVGDWLTPFRPEAVEFDLILSNPPYIRSDEIDVLQPEIRDHEPRQALVAAEDGLACQRQVIETAGAALRAGGNLMMEIGYDQRRAVERLAAASSSYEPAVFFRDLGGHDRVVRLTRRS